MPKPYRVLFLSAAVGAGHARAAEALEAAFADTFSTRLKSKIIDSFRYTNPLLSKMVVNTYMEIIKVTPSVYRYLYQRAEEADSMSDFNKILNNILATKLKKLIIDFRPDIVICTHAFPCGVMSILKRKTKLKVPVVAIITDFTVHGFWIHPNVDLYIVADQELKQYLIQKGIKENNIAATGIPISPKFAEKHDKVALRKSFGLNPHLPTLMVMGGGLGFGPVEGIAKELSKFTLPIQVIVILGKNKNLHKKLDELSKQVAFPLKVLGYVNNIHEIMEMSDLLITKPGGLTSAEALGKNLPMLIINPIPGQEEKNSDFLLANKVAVKVHSLGELKEILERILSYPYLLTEMKENTNKLSKPNSAHEVVNIINKTYFQKGLEEGVGID